MNKKAEIIYLEIEKNKKLTDLANVVLNTCFEIEKIINPNLYVTITLTNPSEIKEINKKFRKIDKETDVLSFPMFEKFEIDRIINDTNSNIEEILGDIVISIERVEQQAIEYSHSFEREFAYMIVHGFYHIMGYDHIKEEDKKIMRKKEENVLFKLNLVQ